MQTLKKWVKIDSSIFTLWDNNQQIGKFEVANRTSEKKANVSFQDKEFVIKKTGFWKSNIEITDQNGQIIAKVYSEKWYGNSYILEYGNKKYKLLVRNNPLAEWAIQDNNKDVLAYGLSTQDGKVVVKIKSDFERPNYLFDFILWYLFEPIATEQCADDLTFLMLIA